MKQIKMTIRMSSIKTTTPATAPMMTVVLSLVTAAAYVYI